MSSRRRIERRARDHQWVASPCSTLLFVRVAALVTARHSALPPESKPFRAPRKGPPARSMHASRHQRVFEPIVQGEHTLQELLQPTCSAPCPPTHQAGSRNASRASNIRMGSTRAPQGRAHTSFSGDCGDRLRVRRRSALTARKPTNTKRRDPLAHGPRPRSFDGVSAPPQRVSTWFQGAYPIRSVGPASGHA